MSILQRWWTDHGTKIIGFGTVAIGAIEYIDSQTIKAIEFIAGPHWGPIASHGLVAAAGFLAAKRGFTNSKNKNAVAAAGP